MSCIFIGAHLLENMAKSIIIQSIDQGAWHMRKLGYSWVDSLKNAIDRRKKSELFTDQTHETMDSHLLKYIFRKDITNDKKDTYR